MTQHIRDVHFKGESHNNTMERFNGELRDREKVMRSLKTVDSDNQGHADSSQLRKTAHGFGWEDSRRGCRNSDTMRRDIMFYLYLR